MAHSEKVYFPRNAKQKSQQGKAVGFAYSGVGPKAFLVNSVGNSRKGRYGYNYGYGYQYGYSEV